MKKYFIFAATALVALTACSKVETEHATPDVKVGYQVAAYLNQTKADSHGHTSFIDELAELGITSGQSFASKAYIHAAQADGTVAAPAAFFNAATNGIETISYTSGSPSTWEPAHVYYWPKASKSSLSFFSWYDFSGANPTITYSADGGEASMAWTNRTVALKDNVLYADAAYHYKSNTSPATHGLNGVTSGVPTLFRHALAKVRFTVKASQVEKADPKNSGYKTFWKVTLSDVALSSGTIKNNGNLTVTQTSSTTATSIVEWSKPTNEIWAAPSTQTYLTENLGNDDGDIFDTDVAQGNEVLTTTAVELTGENFMDDTYFTVLPQDVANGVTLTFKYTIETRYGNDTVDNATLVSTEVVNVTELAGTAPYTATGIQLNAIGTTPIARWQMNHRYVYNIIINPETSTILYDPAVEVWAAEASADVTVPNA